MIYDYSLKTRTGETLNLSDIKGKVIMIVNTATGCGFTPQYDGLEALYQKYNEQGFEIVGFPCDQFAGQEPGSNDEIAEFCRINHGVTFPLMTKTDVNGENAEPIFEYLKAQAPTEAYNGIKGKATRVMLKGLSKTAKKESDILWNFTKFLVNRDGTVIKRYAPITTPEEIEKDLQGML